MDSFSGQKKLLRSGDDIKGAGLFEYMFDCIYVTWACDILMILFGSNKVWFLFLIVPGFLIYRVTSVVKSFLGNKSPSSEESREKAAPTQTKSNRQTKLEQRGQKQRTMRVR